MFYLMKTKYDIFSNIQVTKIERSAFWGTPGIFKVMTEFVSYCFIIFFIFQQLN